MDTQDEWLAPTRRSFLLGAASAVGLGALAVAGVRASSASSAISASAQGGGGGGGATTIRFFEQKAEVQAYFGDLLQRFHKENPSIKTVYEHAENFAPQFVRGDASDVGIYTDNLELARYIKRGQFLDLSHLPAVKKVRADISDLPKQYVSYPGVSVLPYSLAAAGVIYNKTIFAKYQLSVPTTWSEFVDVCDELKKAGETVIYSTDRDVWTLWQGIFDYSVGSLVDPGPFFAKMRELGTDVGPDSEVSFEKTFAVPMERAAKIRSYFNADHAVRSYADGNTAFGKGQVAMYLQGPWALGQIAVVNKNLDIGTFALPVSNNPDDRQARVDVDLGLYISAGTKHKEAAETLLEWFMKPEIINKYNQDNVAYSTLKGAPAQTDPRLAGLQPYVDSSAFYQGAGTYIPTSIPLGNYVQGAVASGDFDSMLRRLDADWRRLASRDGLN